MNNSKLFSLIILSILLVSCNGVNQSLSSSNDESFPAQESSSNQENSSSYDLSSSINDSSSQEEKFDIVNLSQEELTNLNLTGYASEGIGDFSSYLNTSAHRVVTNSDELIQALYDAKYDYETIWDETTSTYTQTLNKEGSVKVIEIANDINLGYYTLSSKAKENTQIVSDYASKYSSLKDYLYFSSMFLENGISQIKIERTSNLMIYSRNGSKLTHAGFKLTSCDNIVFRNIEFDELWQWEDGIVENASKIGDYDAFGWAYFKIGFCGHVWIDHCKFGKSYDGQIDYANANYHSTKSTSFRAPYGTYNGKGLSITWCDFAAGDDSEDGYLYKMMKEIDDAYKNGTSKCLYYNALRDADVTFEEIMYGLVIPQKKGFLIGDDQDYKEDDHVEYDYNLELFVSFANCRFTNFEDRIPKVRGGNIYMHNCIADSSQYFAYRTKLSSMSASSIVKKVNGGWKCALVSQGIVCGQGASVKAENCIFLGINTLLKNNDSGSMSPYNCGGYQLVNCKYECGNTSYTGSSSDENNEFKNSNPSTLATKYFKWNNETNTQPYNPLVLIDLDDLSNILSNKYYGVGTSVYLEEQWLTFIYK